MTTPGAIVGNRCYGHLGGRLGAALLARFLELGWLDPVQDGRNTRYGLTDEGARGLAALGVAPSALGSAGERPRGRGSS